MIKSAKEMNDESLDLEWIELMKTAIKIGLTVEEVHEFLMENRKS